jgi:hypothetical protein
LDNLKPDRKGRLGTLHAHQHKRGRLAREGVCLDTLVRLQVEGISSGEENPVDPETVLCTRWALMIEAA